MAPNRTMIDISTARRWANLKEQGMTTREIADRFGVALNTVNRQIARAMGVADESAGEKEAKTVATDAEAQAANKARGNRA